MEEQERKKVSVFEDDEIPYEVRMKSLIEGYRRDLKRLEALSRYAKGLEEENLLLQKKISKNEAWIAEHPDKEKLIKKMDLEIRNLKGILRKGFPKHKHAECTKALKRLLLESPTPSKMIRLKPMHFHSKTTSLNHCILMSSLGKKDFKEKGPFYVIYSYFYKDYGLYAFLFLSQKELNMAVYTPHFFDRYRERFLKDPTMDKMKVIERFFTYNGLSDIVFVKNEKYQNSFFGRCKDGVVLGTRYSDKIIEIKTFLSDDELKDEQIDWSNHTFESLRKYILEHVGDDIILK